MFMFTILHVKVNGWMENSHGIAAKILRFSSFRSAAGPTAMVRFTPPHGIATVVVVWCLGWQMLPLFTVLSRLDLLETGMLAADLSAMLVTTSACALSRMEIPVNQAMDIVLECFRRFSMRFWGS